MKKKTRAVLVLPSCSALLRDRDESNLSVLKKEGKQRVNRWYNVYEYEKDEED